MRWKLSVLGWGAFLGFALAGAASADDAADAAASSTVRGFTDTMMSVLKDAETLGFQGRYERLRPAVEKAFDLEFMSEKSLGSHWRKLTPEQQRRWRETFTHYTTANYASRLNRFSGQKFEHLGEEEAARETMVVRTRVIDPADENVDLNYRLHETPEGWKIVDIYLRGTVSELALRRSDYTAVIKNQGFEALDTSLQQKAQNMAAGKTG